MSVDLNRSTPSTREIIYDLLDEGRRHGDFELTRRALDTIVSYARDKLDGYDTIDPFGFWEHGHSEEELADIVDDWFDARRIGEVPEGGVTCPVCGAVGLGQHKWNCSLNQR
jgi:hypothetical protein